MIKKFTADHRSLLIFLAASTFAVAAALAAVSQYPLFLSNSPQPNVMILLDNSGSMDTIMQHPGYDPSTTYTGTFRNEIYFQKNDYFTGNSSLETSMRTDTLQGNADGFTRNSRPRVKLPLPYVNTRWDGNYLNWIFYHATDSQYQSLATDPPLQKTRIQTARGVISNLVKTYSGISFGLSKFNESRGGSDPQGGRVVNTCGTLTASNVDTTVNGINAETWTPLGETVAEVWHYFKGGTSPYNSGTTYTTPITASCQKNFVIIVTDGEPTYDGCYRGDYSSYGCSNSEMATSRLADVTGYMHTHDAVASLPGSVINSYTIGLTLDSALLRAAAANGGGQYYTTNSGISLDTAFQNALSDILQRSSSGSAATVSTGYLSSATKLYRGLFESSDWTGSIQCWSVSTNTATKGDLVGYPTTPLWEAGALLNARGTPRSIYTAGSISGRYQRIEFVTSNQSTLVSAGFTNYSTSWISYVRGDSTPTGYRARRSKLGDIIYSSPLLVGPPSSYYDDNNYSGFKRSNSSRRSIVLVGANDGMLHAFNAETGEEEWGFIPSSLLGKLKLLRSLPYVHTNYVNGTITVGDAFIPSKGSNGVADSSAGWHTIAVGGLREGGKTYFALDITNPGEPIPLWEVTSATTNGLGYSFGTPLIVKVKDATKSEGYRWVALLSNGYEGATSGRAATLLVVDLATGTIVREIVADSATFTGVSPNGLASPAAIDKDGDGVIDYIYAGDLKGQVWKFDLTNSDTTRWSCALLFAAKDPSAAAQPITTTPEVVIRGSYQVVFVGTGKYIESTDKTNTQTQSFYGLFDRNTTPAITRADLTRQTFTQVTQNGQTWRVSSGNTVGSSGWYIDLPISGERVISDPIARTRKIIFTTFVPSSDPCSPGGSSWLIELNMDTGGTVIKPAFDVTGNMFVDNNDVVTVGTGVKMPTGTLLGEGVAFTPTVVGSDQGMEYKFISRSTGDITKVLEGGGISQFGPRSWRFLRMSSGGY